MKKQVALIIFWLIATWANAQISDAELDYIDSLIESTPTINLCLKDGKEDLRFFNKAPEKYSNFKQVFITKALETISFSDTTSFKCDIDVEINCQGQAGNYNFAIEPRTFQSKHVPYFVLLIQLIQSLQNYPIQPAQYLGETVNSTARFTLITQGGKPALLNR